jgi:small-conductance mechanosensitive channel
MMLYLQSLTDNLSVEWLYAVFAAFACYVLVLNARNFVVKRLERLAHHSPRRVHPIVVEVAKRTHRVTIFMMSLLIGVAILNIGSHWSGRINQLWFIVIGFQIAAWINCGVLFWSAARLKGAKASATQNGAHGAPEHNPVITTMLSWLLRVLLWSMLLLAVLANLGVDITAFVASLGVGGIAVALAVQSILSDVFASAAIGLDKPFELGDFIVFGDVAGSIEQIGLKTTRIRSLSGEEIVCSNTELLKNTIHNYKRMQERRILFTFQLPFDTPLDVLTAVPDLVAQAVQAAGMPPAEQPPGLSGEPRVAETSEAVPGRTSPVTRFDRAHLKSFGHSGLEFEVVYYVTDAAYGVYMDVQQAINFALLRNFSQRGIRFAFPARTVHLARGANALDAAHTLPADAVSGKTATYG